MPKKKPTYPKREQKRDAKNVQAIRDAWARAGYPKEGIDYEGVHYTPLDFADWPKQQSEAAKAGK